MAASPPKPLRCAIYTRVSTDAGLEQDFNSLDAQREASEAYIKSQAHEGWRLVPTAYDDGGFSGGSLERPALKRLLADIQAKRIDVVLVYKVDRLTRSLADFAKLVELFDQHSASFVSVTQAFNTTTSMGRLTLNVLLSFAQFEREVTAERIRDKIAASKKKGIWVGGTPALGYRVEDRKLLPDPAEADTVRMIFRRYLELGSMLPLLEELHRTGVRTRKKQLSTGKVVGGIPFTKGPLSHLLKNRTYIGELNHHDHSYPGEHLPIVERHVFDSAQAQMAKNSQAFRIRRAATGALLQGKIVDDRGNRMTPTYSKKGGQRYRYYACCLLTQGRRSEAGSVRRVAATDIEQRVIEVLRSSAREGRLLCKESQLDDQALIATTVERITLEADTLVIEWQSGACKDPQQPFEVPWKPSGRRPKREILLPHTDPAKDHRPIRSEVRVSVVKAIASGRSSLAQLLADPALTMDVLAEREGRSKRSLQMLMSLSFLAPDIVQALVAGKLPRGIGITKLTHLPASWDKQRDMLGLAARS